MFAAFEGLRAVKVGESGVFSVAVGKKQVNTTEKLEPRDPQAFGERSSDEGQAAALSEEKQCLGRLSQIP